VDGEVVLDGRSVLKLAPREMRQLRGGVVSMIFQDPMTSLNPVFTVGDQISEAITIHQHSTRRQARRKAIDLLEMTRIPRARDRIDDYPFEFSGGMRQRAMIAMALACRPKLLIADEPTTALDVTIQAQILQLIRDLRQSNRTAILLITHDLGVVAEMAQRVIVMYAGKIIEIGTANDIFYTPHHPYTRGLLNSIPRLTSDNTERLYQIEGNPPQLVKLPTGCSFRPRCKHRSTICSHEIPVLRSVGKQHRSACHFDTGEQTAPRPLA
jgi:oligopeptide/dipeptide ABC transporter ATP-binding protein